MSSSSSKSNKGSKFSSNKSGLLHGKRKRDNNTNKWDKQKNGGKKAPPPLTGKAAKRQRQLEKPHGDKVVQAKALWNKLRDQNVEAEQRKALVADIMSLIGDTLWEIVARHDASRVVQACFHYGEKSHQEAIMQALSGKCYELSTTQYGHHLIKCVLRHGTNEIRGQVISELTGKVVKLCTHATGSSILELLYNGFKGYKIASKLQLFTLFKECYGREFLVFSDNAPSLEEFLEKRPESHEGVMGDLHILCERIITKGYHRFSYTHKLLHDYFAHCGPARMSAIVPSIVEATMHLASTPLGASVLCNSLVAGGAKERKKIVKHFRGNATQVAQHECGHLVLMRALDVVDDTVLMRKAVVAELAESCIELALDQYGYRVLMQLIKPNSGRYVTNAKHMKILTSVSTTSKKEPEARREEHLKTLRAPLIQGCVDRCGELLRSQSGRSILLEVFKQWHPTNLCETLGSLLGALVHKEMKEGQDKDEDDEEDDEDDDEDDDVKMTNKEEDQEVITLEHFEIQHLTNELLKCEEEYNNAKSNDDKVGVDTSKFTTIFWEAAKESAVDMASKNRTAYLIETMLKGSIVSDQIKEALDKSEKDIKNGLKTFKKSDSIKAIVDLLFPLKKKATARKKKAPPAKKKAPPAKKKAPPAKKKAASMKKKTTEKSEEQAKPVLRRSTRARKRSI